MPDWHDGDVAGGSSGEPRDAGGLDGACGADPFTQVFEAHRGRLLRVAYATLGSLSEAEDCVQEAWLRLRRVENPAAIADLGAWLTTTVSRLALDALGSARARRERYVGPWLPEPLVEDASAADPADRVTLDESVSMALLVVLERLSPAERTSFVLHEVFGLPFEEVGSVVGRSPAAVRQLAARAREHVRRGRPRFPPTAAEQRELVAAFAAACQQGDLERLVSLLDPGVVWRADGGGKVSAAHPVERGARQVARVVLAFARRPPRSVGLVTVNGAPGLVLRDADGVLTVLAVTVDAGRIVALDAIRNPDKLTAVPDRGGIRPHPH
jgi:RNA polymerase sigma-70 factor, ECF subfamily